MMASLTDLLASCGVSGLREPDAWERVVLMHNQGGVPGDQADGDVVWNRGFNLLILDHGGRPTHFCKCRSSDPALTGRESLASRLSAVPELSRIVPRGWTVHTEEMELAVSTYLTGELLDRRLRRMSGRALRVALLEILDASDKVATHAARIEPALLAGTPCIDLAAAAGWTFPILREAGIPDASLDAVARALGEAGRVPRALQHGDLWPRNVIAADGGWWLLDYEMYGRVQVPLYDAAHLLRTSWERREGRQAAGTTWLEWLRSGRAGTADYADVLHSARRRAGLEHEQACGAIVHYVVDMAARLLSRHVAAADSRPYVHEVERLGERLARGEPLASVTPASD